MLDNLAPCIYCGVQPFTPPGYLKGRSNNDRTHILTVNTVYELPMGHGRKYLSNMNLAPCIYCGVQPFTPPGYLKGRSNNDRTHILTVNTVYELPMGHGRKYLSNM